MVATRARRANAGSRLKQLLELEEQAADAQNSVAQIITEDDENVNLLFQEDADDQEFLELLLEDEDQEEDEDEEERDGEEGEGTPTPAQEVNELVSEDEAKVNSDDVLSDSDISLSDTDEDEGEKELQEQEKMKKRKLKKLLSIIPAIKKVKVAPTDKPKEKPVKKRKSDILGSDSMLLSLRRSSSRASAVENKQALIERLKESEKRRAAQAPVIRVKERELTQEERLAEAVETEKANVLSLNQFREQEIVKNEYRKQLLLLKRVKLRNVIRFITKESLVTPLDEIDQARIVYELNNPKSKSGRRKKGTFSFDADPNPRLPGKIDPELPYYKQEMEEKRKLEEQEKEAEKEAENKEGEPENGLSMDESKEKENEEKEEAPVKENEEKEEEPVKETDEKLEEKKEKEDTNENDIEIDKEEKQDEEKNSLDAKEEEKEELEPQETKDVDIEMNETEGQLQENADIDMGESGADKEPEVKEPEVKEPEVKEPEEKDENEEKKEKEEKEEKEENENKEETPVKQENEVKTEPKRVTFDLDEPEETPDISSSKQGSVEVEETKQSNKILFEGPPQKVARNTIYLIDFDEDDKNMRLSDHNVKAILFGEQATLPASRFLKETTTILRIGNVENPYAVVKEEKDEMFESIDDITEENPMFDELKRLPRLGVAEEFIEEEEEDTKEEETVINIKTEAPTGLYLPNGNKKNCLITGAEVKYFDPSNGIPYSSVETYKVLKAIEQGNIPWYNVSSDFNSWGGAEVYLGSRDGSVRHAKGVPEGFDA